MKRKSISLIFLSMLLRAADTPVDPQSVAMQISSFNDLVPGLEAALGPNHNWETTAIGIDFDETIAHLVLDLPCNKRMDHLLSGELETIDNVVYPRALAAKQALGIPENERLSVAAYQKGGYFKLKEQEQKKNYAQLMHSLEQLGQGEQIDQIKRSLANSFPYAGLPLKAAINSDIRANQYYEYMEPQEVIKAAVKALQLKGAFVGICSVGNKDEARDGVQRDIGIKREHWARGENKFKRLSDLVQEFPNNRKNPEAGPFSTFILIDNFGQGARDFAALASAAGFKGVAVYYDNIDNKIITSPEVLIKEFKDIACEQGQAAPSAWQSTVGALWSLGGY